MVDPFEEWKKKYPNYQIFPYKDTLKCEFISHSDSGAKIFFRKELGNCGAVQIGRLSAATESLLVALFDWCSIQGITVIYGSMSKKNFSISFYRKYFNVIHEYTSNREGDEMVYFMRVLKDPYAKGYTKYYGPLSDKSYLLSEEKS